MEKKKRKRTNYQTIKLNLSRARRKEYESALRRRYNRPKSGLARLVICALREVLYLEQEGIPPCHADVDDDENELL